MNLNISLAYFILIFDGRTDLELGPKLNYYIYSSDPDKLPTAGYKSSAGLY